MVGTAGNILTPALNKQLVALQRTARSINTTSLQLASGLRVNSALDNPQNYFASFALSSQASDFSRLLDGIAKSIRTIQSADSAVRALDDLVQLAETEAQQSLSDIAALNSERGSVSDLILADNPDFYYRLDETSGTVAVNSNGAVPNASYNGGVGLNAGNLYFSDTASSARFDGVNDRIRLPNNILINTDAAGYPEKTVELFFNADDVSGGKQVLYEQGGTGNALSIYIDDSRVYTTVRDNGDYGPFDISAAIESGKTYHVALTLDDPNSTFTGYLNGEVIGTGVVTRPLSRHGGAVAIGRNEGGTVFHDGPNAGNGEYFAGRISDVASYNAVISQENLRARYDAALIEETQAAQERVQELLEPINPLIEDSAFLGVNLLLSDTLNTDFNVERTSSLQTTGANFSLAGAGLDNLDFSTPNSFSRDVNQISAFRQNIERFNSSLANDLSIIENREDFTRETINNLETGADDLTLADQNEVGAELLALQVRQDIQVTTLSLAGNQQRSVAELLFAQAPGSGASGSNS